MVVRELVALLGVKSDEKSMKKAENGMKKLKDLAKQVVAGFGLIQMGRFFKNAISDAIEFGDWFDKMAERTGLAAETLQRFQHAAELSGASLEAIENSIRYLQKAQVDAEAGLTTYTREFDRLGINIKDTNGELKNSEELLYEMADAIQALPTDAERTAVAMKLMGRQGTQMLPMLKKGGDAIREMAREVDELGATMSTETATSFADLKDDLYRLETGMRGAKLAIATGLMPWLSRAAEQTVKWWKANQAWIREDIEMAMKRIGRVLNAISRFFGKVTKGVIQFMNAWKKSKSAIRGVIVVVGLLGAAITAGPIGRLLALGALIGLVIEDFEVWREGGNSAIGEIIKSLDKMLGIDFVGKMSTWLDFAMTTFASMTQVIEAFWDFFFNSVGDSETAWNNLVNRLYMAWRSFWDNLEPEPKKYLKFYKAVLDEMGRMWDEFIAPIDEFFTSGVGGSIGRFFKGTGKTMKYIAEAPPATQGLGMRPYGGGKTQVQQNLDMKVVINAPPGMSQQQLQQMTENAVSNAMDRQNREAIKAFVPTVANPSVFG